MLQTMDRQAFLTLPALHRACAAIQVGGYFLPGIQPVADGSHWHTATDTSVPEWQARNNGIVRPRFGIPGRRSTVTIGQGISNSR